MIFTGRFVSARLSLLAAPSCLNSAAGAGEGSVFWCGARLQVVSTRFQVLGS